MSKHDDSFNMIVGTSNKEIDLFDNPFMAINVYEMTEKWVPKLSAIQLQICTKQ